MTTLFVSQKRKHNGLEVCMKEIERWANNETWHGLSYATNWADSGGAFQLGQYMQDPFGWVSLRGAVKYTGTIIAGATSTVAVLVPSFTPVLDESFMGACSASSEHFFWIKIDNAGNIIITNQTSGNVTNPSVSISGVRFTTW